MDTNDDKKGNERRTYTVVAIIKVMVDNAAEHDSLVSIASQIIENELRETFDEANYQINDDPPIGFSAKVDNVQMIKKQDLH